MRGIAISAAAATLCCACGNGEKAGPTISRDRDAAAVVVVQRPGTARVNYTDEIEPNDEVSAPQPLRLPGGIRGTLDGAADRDLYVIEVPEAGWLALALSGIEGVDLVLELLDADGAALARSDRGPAKTDEGMPNIRVDAGRYVVAVSEFVKKPKKRKKRRRRSKRKPEPPAVELRTGASATYELAAVLSTTEPGKNHEREPNEEVTAAAELLLGVDGFGYVGWRDDRDRWRLTLDNFGPDYSLDVDVAQVDGVRLRVAVLDDNGDVVVRRIGDKGKAVAVRNLIPKKGDDNVYIVISGRGSNPRERYALRMGSRLLESDEEREPNDGRKRATQLTSEESAVSGGGRGYLVAGDQDWYRLTVGSSSLLTVSVTPPAEVDVAVSVMNAAGSAIAEADVGKKGDREELTGVPAKRGTVYIKVHGKGTAEVLEPYELRWTTAPGGAALPAPATPTAEPDPTYDPY